jgi:hypothetical protein
MRASDGAFWATKFANSPQGERILANEFFGSRLGLWLGLPVAQVEIIETSQWLIDHAPELCIELASGKIPCASGRQVGSRYAGDPIEDQIFDYLPESMFPKVRGPSGFHKILVLDKWTGNCDGRQAVFSKKRRQRLYRVTFIDQAYCFHQNWNFSDAAFHGVYYRNFVYAEVAGWESFEPQLSKAEQADLIDIWRCAEPMPPEWYGHDRAALEQLVETLYRRRKQIRDLIAAFRDSSRNPFPKWKSVATCSVPSGFPIDAQ